MRRTVSLGVFAAVLIGSFLFTLWIIDPEPAPDVTHSRPASERLASQKVFNVGELIEAAKAAGVQFSPRMKGNIESIKRVQDRDVSIAGWVADPDGDATPLNVFIFIAGPAAAVTQTKGERPDVTAAIGLGLGAEKNVNFQATFKCNAGDQPIVVGMGREGRYTRLTAPKCP